MFKVGPILARISKVPQKSNGLVLHWFEWENGCRPRDSQNIQFLTSTWILLSKKATKLFFKNWRCNCVDSNLIEMASEMPHLKHTRFYRHLVRTELYRNIYFIRENSLINRKSWFDFGHINYSNSMERASILWLFT